MSVSIAGLTIQRGEGATRLSLGQGVGVARDGVNGEIVAFSQEDGRRYSVTILTAQPQPFTGRRIQVACDVADIGPWLTEEEIATIKRRKEAERAAGAVDLTGTIYTDIEQLRKEIQQGIGVLDECLSRVRSIGEMSVMVGIALETIEGAIKQFNAEGLARDIREYSGRVESLLSGSERDPQDG